MKKDLVIHCPKCEYRPQPEDRWTCMPSCGTSWHTFWTGGVCPGCGFKWPKTQCPACGECEPCRTREAAQSEDAENAPFE